MIIKSLVALCWCPNELFSSGHLLVRPPVRLKQTTLLWLLQFGRPPAPSSPQRTGEQSMNVVQTFLTPGVHTCAKVTFCSFSLHLPNKVNVKF